MSRLPVRGGQVVNAIYDTPGVSDDVAYQQTASVSNNSRRCVYQPPGNKADRTMLIGEVAVARTNKWTPGTQEDVHVRTCLNGMMFPSRTPSEVAATPNGKVALLKEMREKIRFAGIVNKTVQYDASRPDLPTSDQPTFLAVGHLTVANLGDQSIEVGNAMEAYLVSPDTMNQHEDGVNFFSPNRVVVGLRPLAMHQDVLDMINDRSRPEMRNALVAMFEAGAPGSGERAIGAFIQKLNDPENRVKANRMLHAARAASLAQMNKVQGVSTTGCEVGQHFNLANQPLSNLVSRSRVPLGV